MRGAAGGFTLVEMVVALAILSLVLLGTVTGLRTLAATQLALDRQTVFNDDLRAVSGFLRNGLDTAIVGRNTGGLSVGGGDSERTVFAVGPQSLVWKAGMRFGESQGGSQVLRVAQEGDQVVLRWQPQPSRGGLRDWNNAPAKTLLEDVDSFEVAYRRNPGGSWRSGWDRGGAPRWVRVRVRTGGRYWPDMVIEVAQ